MAMAPRAPRSRLTTSRRLRPTVLCLVLGGPYCAEVWLKWPDAPAMHCGQGWAGLLPASRGIRAAAWPAGPGLGLTTSTCRPPRGSATSARRHARFASPGACSSSGRRLRQGPGAKVSIGRGQPPRGRASR